MKQKILRIFRKPVAVLVAAVLILTVLPLSFSAAAEETDEISLCSFDDETAMEGWSITGASPSYSPDVFKEGTGALLNTPTRSRPVLKAERSFSEPVSYLGGVALKVWLYTEDPTEILRVYVDISSAGVAGRNGLRWIVRQKDLLQSAGWQELVFFFDDPTVSYGKVDLSAINYLRIYVNGGYGTAVYGLDDLRLEQQSYYTTLLSADSLFQELTYFTDHATLLSTEQYHSGEGSYVLSRQTAQASTSPQFFTSAVTADIKTPSRAKVSLWLYLDSSSTVINDQVTLELGSAGEYDRDEYEWQISLSQLTEDTWTQIKLPFSEGEGYTLKKTGSPDLSALNFLRVFGSFSNTVTLFVDEIAIIGSDADVTADTHFKEEIPVLGDDMSVYPFALNSSAIPSDTGNFTLGISSVDLSDPAPATQAAQMIGDPGAVSMNLSAPAAVTVTMKLYVDDVSKIKEMMLELTSSGKYDYAEINKSLKTSLKSNDWATISFPVSSMTAVSKDETTINYTAINYLRLYYTKQETSEGSKEYRCPTVLVDDFRIINTDPENEIRIAGNKKLDARVITPTYPTTDTVIADAVVTEAPYSADPTGAQDATDAIEAALSDVSASGGGTVWMPAGKYKITRHIRIPSYVTLRGDWQDPDTVPAGNAPDYGTVLLAYDEEVTSSNYDAETQGLIWVGDSGGLEGVTVYYPEQSLTAVKQYPWTVFISNYMLKTVKNVTILNAYRGIGTIPTPSEEKKNSAHEQMMIENVRITALFKGVADNNSADVDIIDNLSVSGKYWAGATKLGTCPTQAQITTYCKNNQATGLWITDCEQCQYSNVSVNGYYYGVNCPAAADGEYRRHAGSGSMYHFTISDCTYGFYTAPGLYTGMSTDGAIEKNPSKPSVDSTLGYLIANSTFTDCTYGISHNAGKVTQGTTYYTNDTYQTTGSASNESSGLIKLSGCTFTNVTTKLSGNSKASIKEVSVSHSAAADVLSRETKTTGTGFIQLYEGANRQKIQASLNAVGNAGGGVVYLHAGKYILDGSLTVPANVELRGAASVTQRIASRGTVLMVTPTRTLKYVPGSVETDTANLASDTAAITLNGKNAGISGIYLMYADNVQQIGEDGTFSFTPYALRGTAEGVYCVNCCIAGSSYGVDFSGCDSHTINHLMSSCTDIAVTVGGKNGMVANSMNHATVLSRNYYVRTKLSNTDNHNYYCYIGRVRNQYFHVSESTGQKLVNNFTYGIQSVVHAENATNLTVINLGADTVGNLRYGYAKYSGNNTSNTITDKTYLREGTMLSFTNCTNATVINSLQIFGVPYQTSGANTLRLYNLLYRDTRYSFQQNQADVTVQ